MRRHVFAVAAGARRRSRTVFAARCSHRRPSPPAASDPRVRRRRRASRLAVARSNRVDAVHRLLPVRLRRLAGGQSDAGRPAAMGPLRRAAGTQLRRSCGGCSRRRRGGRGDREEVGDYYAAAWTRRRSRRRAWRRSSRTSGASPRSTREGRPAGAGRRIFTASASTRSSASAPNAISRTRPRQIADVDQGGLGLPDRDYYLKTDARSLELKQKYQAHVRTMLGAAGDAARRRRQPARAPCCAIETALAEARARPHVPRRDPAAHRSQR